MNFICFTLKRMPLAWIHRLGMHKRWCFSSFSVFYVDGRQNPLVINRCSSLAKPENRKLRMTRMPLSLTHRSTNSSAASLFNDRRVFSKLKTAHCYLKCHDVLFWLKRVLRELWDRNCESVFARDHSSSFCPWSLSPIVSRPLQS